MCLTFPGTSGQLVGVRHFDMVLASDSLIRITPLMALRNAHPDSVLGVRFFLPVRNSLDSWEWGYMRLPRFFIGIP